MNETTMTVDVEEKNYFKPVTRYSISLTSCLFVLFLTFGAIRAQADWPHVVPSKDGTPISYEIYGAGESTLVFVHGWSCDARYWRAQLPHFAENHRVVMLDLAGHGHSGTTRSQYTMRAFGRGCKSSDRSNRQPQGHSDRTFHGRVSDCRSCPTHAEPCQRANRCRYT